MKILVITGSPRRRGTSSLLADSFVDGATQAGHQVKRFDAAFKKIRPCQSCYYCRQHAQTCVQQDDMQTLKPEIFEAECIVFVTPLFYFGMSSQLKSVIDRFFAFNDFLTRAKKKTVLLATCGDNNEKAMDALKSHYQAIGTYLNWPSIGEVYANGVYAPEDLSDTNYLKQAFQCGFNLK